MSLKQFNLIFVTIFCVFSQTSTQTWEYTHYRSLDYYGDYIMGWRFNETDIEFELTVKTSGYVGFGISETGQMNPADILIGWISGTNMYLGDYYTNSESRTPYMDSSQDWVIQDGYEQNGTTVLRFSRKLITCDPADQPITRDRMQLIWSYGGDDPDIQTGLVPYHGDTKRGTTSIFLLEGDMVPAEFPPAETYMIPLQNHDYTIPATGSSLQCIVFGLSRLIPESHMIKFEANITRGNEAYVYRMNLYRCNLRDQTLDGARFNCTDEAPMSVKSCKNVVASWSMGAESFHFPSNVGIPMGGPNDPYSYVLEIHYSKYEDATGPEGIVSIPDNSGLVITYTTSPIANEAGMLEIGKVISPGWQQIIPEKEEAFISSSFCSPRCLNWGFAADKSPVKAVAVMLKGNDVVSEIKLRHYRGNEELPWITVDRKFSNFFQGPRLLNSPVTLQSTDSLSVECTFNTSTRTGVTRGGWARIEEVCRATIVYYPAKPFDMCLSWSSYDNLFAKNGTKIPEQSAVDYLSNITQWDGPTKGLFKQALKNSNERSICSSISRQPAYAIDRFKLPSNTRRYTETPSCRNI